MAPRNSGEKEDVEPVRVSSSPLLLNNLKKAIPQEAFEKSIPKSIYYMACDYTMWFGLVAIMKGVKGTLLWDGLALWQQIAVSICFWAATGTFMWAIFMIGHDCGHGTFSEYESVNDFFGHLTHGSLLVPFYPWQVLCRTLDIAFIALTYARFKTQSHRSQYELCTLIFHLPIRFVSAMCLYLL